MIEYIESSSHRIFRINWKTKEVHVHYKWDVIPFLFWKFKNWQRYEGDVDVCIERFALDSTYIREQQAKKTKWAEELFL